MKITLIIREQANLLGLRFSKRINRSAREALAAWGFHWNSIAKVWTATRTEAREAVARLIAAGDYPGIA